MDSALQIVKAKNASLYIYSTQFELGNAASAEAANIMRDAISQKGCARIVVGTGNSQIEVIDALVRAENLDWKAVEVFHMDEYVGISASHPASFRGWLTTHLADITDPGHVHYLEGDCDNLDEECHRYGDLLCSAPIDLCFVGFGENGHIAFNDPHVADFNDPLVVKRVSLDRKCRLQQVGEGHFPNLEAVPREAITLTCPTLMAATHLICCVPERRKAEAVRNAVEGPLCHDCPASLVFTHSRASVYLDTESAGLLKLYP